MKKWMVYVTHGERDVSWTKAGELMNADREEFDAWGAWYLPVRHTVVVVTYPEWLDRAGDGPPGGEYAQKELYTRWGEQECA